MVRGVLLSLVVLTAAFGLIITVIHAREYQYADLRTLIAPSASCSQPCWEGIRPNITAPREAVALLEAHPWVREVQVTPGKISWWWNGSQPDLYDTSVRAFHGRMETAVIDGVEVVTAIIINTRAAFGDVVLTMGEAEAMTLYAIGGEDSRAGVAHVAEYNTRGMTVFTLLECPMTVESFWNASSVITFGIPTLAFEGEKIQRKAYELPERFFLNNSPICG